ncbi:hypothetical protein SLEP1_g25868 [Rubroshorea leprosula]|uniref:Cystatin domain-containing protein n=1 Tax=Rubroshorea leprosula TaxID=152421 RepID=A0AAV5JUR6_9ROSI|nr:hypothetical protein SLEP1_g25868 [Rubroshorea leprosula]
MKSNFCFFFLSISLLFLPDLICADDEEPIGKWIPIKDLTDSYLQTIAVFAVGDINQQSKKTLTLNRILEGEKNTVRLATETHYRLLLAVKDGAQSER